MARDILIVSTTGLGDSLWATPAIKALKKKYPDQKISILTHALGKQVFANNPYVDQVYILKKPFIFSFFSLLALRKFFFKKILVFHASQRLVFFLVGLLQAKEKISHSGMNKGLDNLFTRLVKKTSKHEVLRRLELDDLKEKSPKLEFFLTEKEKAFGNNFLRSKKTIIAVHPGAKDSYKRYPLDYFFRIIQKISEHLPVKILLSGTETSLLSELKKKLPEALSLEGLSLREYAAVLTGVDLLLTNDTGPMHLASALDVPLAAFFGPTDPKICGPLQYKGEVFSVEKTCFTCLKRNCLEPFCLRQISPLAVAEKALRILEKEKHT